MKLEEFYAHLENTKGPRWIIPRIDFAHGASLKSSVLFLLESPGPQVRTTRLISLNNNDPSASNLKKQLLEARVPLREVVLWNVVPWIAANGRGFETPTSAQITEAREQNLLLFNVFRSLATIVFVGKKAQREFVFYSGHTDSRLLASHHPSAQAMTVRQRWKENVEVFKRIQPNA